jgi:D-glycero-D-manno-heptose 1,7-bisphosphate phosphatase
MQIAGSLPDLVWIPTRVRQCMGIRDCRVSKQPYAHWFKPMRKLILLDRDGTVNEEVHYLSRPDQLKLIPGVAAGIRQLNQAGFAVAIVTNQSGIARGYLSVATLEIIHLRLRELLAAEGAVIDGIFFCPHLPSEECSCRKPQPQLAHHAARDLGVTLQGAIVIGDKECDILLGKAIKATNVLVRTGHGTHYEPSPEAQPDWIFPDLKAASDWIISSSGLGH